MSEEKDAGQRSAVKQALFAIKDLKARLATAEAAAEKAAGQENNEPIAVIGMACRLPGGISSPEEYWEFLKAGKDGVIEVPADRWDINAYYSPEKPKAGKMYLREGGFLQEDLKGFDADFFNITAREADYLDPQQRLLLEVSYEALERAGVRPDALRNSQTGVFVGIMNLPYLTLQHTEMEQEGYTAYSGSGGLPSAASGRISFFHGLQGPNFPIDTACSSSLVAIDLALDGLRLGKCDLALAGGVNLFLTPEDFIMRCQAQMVSPEGRCKTFDESANGYGPGEGCGIVVFKRLSDAERDGDHILGLVRGAMVNNDGPASALTVPNGVAQQRVIRKALERGGVQAGEVGYVECHGTGTPLGDPIEVGAIQAVYGKAHRDTDAVVIGSAKSNLGHLESAAGIAGFMKAILCVEKGKIPPSIHFHNLNPKIELEGSGVRVADQMLEFPGTGPRRAAISSFGFSGTNAHVVVESPPATAAAESASSGDEPQNRVLVLTARKEAALVDQAGRFAEFLNGREEDELNDICYTAGQRRTRFESVAVYPARTKEELVRALGETGENIRTGKTKVDADAKIAFVYSGQGSQWAGMGGELLESEPVFRAKIEQIDRLLREKAGADWSLIEELKRIEDSRLDETEIAQPAIFAVQVALTELWRAYGVEPSAVVGHSVGEVAAACVSGMLDLETAVFVIYHRARLMQKATGLGKMAAAGITAEEGRKLIAGQEDRLSVAAINSPNSIVFSGEEAALEQVLMRISEDVFKKMLPVNYAFHSPQMEPFKKELVSTLGELKPAPAALPIFSTVTGKVAGNGEYDAAYWGDNVRGAVSFAPAIESMIEDGYTVFLEVGAHPVLQQPVKQCLEQAEKQGVAVTSLRRGAAERMTFLANLGELIGNGIEPIQERILPAGKTIPLPTYAWQREKYWLEITGRRSAGAGGPVAAGDLKSWTYETAWVEQESPGEVTLSGWVIFSDAEIGPILQGLCLEAEQECILITPGDSYSKVDKNHYQLRIAEREDFDKFVHQVLGKRLDVFWRIVHLWPLDSTRAEATTVNSLERDQERGVISALNIAQAGNEVTWQEVPHIWLVTRGVHSVAGSAAESPAQAPLWGFGRTMAVEHGANWGGIIDIDPGQAADEAALSIFGEIITAEREGGVREDQIAFRSGKRYVARLHPKQFPDPEPITPAADASYLITGGLTGIGLMYADWLVDRGAKHLLLLGRTALPDRSLWDDKHDDRVAERIEGVKRLEAKGAKVLAASVDTADDSAFAAFLESLKEQWPPIRGVMHSAGVLESKSLLETTRADMEKVLRPKVAGGWVLHKHFSTDALDFFVLFSSVSGTLTGMGDTMAHYASANFFLDGLAHYRRGLGRTALSVAWGPWADVGYTAQSEAGARMVENFARKGIASVTPERGIEILERLIQADAAQSTVIQIDWPLFLNSYPIAPRAPLFIDNAQAVGRGPIAPSAGEPTADGQAAPAGPAGELSRDILVAAETDERGPLLQNYFRNTVAQVTRTDPARWDVNRSLQESGVDSLMAVELRNRIDQDLGFDISAAKIIDGSSIAQITEQLLKKLSPDELAGPGTLIEYPLSYEQKGLWYLSQLNPESSAYNTHCTLKISAPVDPAVLARAFEDLIGRHDILRSTFVEKGGVPTRFAHETVPLDFEHYQEHELEGFGEDDLLEILKEELNITFNQQKGPLIKLRLLSVAADHQILSLLSNQIVLDGDSIHNAARELLKLYARHAAGQAPDLNEARQFSEFEQWQRDLLASPRAEELESYWMERLSGELTVVQPPADRIRPPVRIHRGRGFQFPLAPDLVERLEKLAGESGVAVESVLCAAFFALLYKLTEQEDILIGFPVLPTYLKENSDAVGVFTTPAVLRGDLTGKQSFLDLLKQVEDILKGAREHRDFPFPALVERLKPLRYPARSPVFQILFETEGFNGAEAEPFELPAESMYIPPQAAPYELILKIARSNGKVHGEITYKTDVFNEKTMSGGIERYLLLLGRVASEPASLLRDFQIILEAENSVFEALNEPMQVELTAENNFVDNLMVEPEPANVVQLFEKVAAMLPGSVAIATGSMRMTYGELNSRANRLARALVEQGIKPGSIVALCTSRSNDLLVGYLAALKTGGTVLPLDPAYSIVRLNLFLQEAECDLLIAPDRYRDRFTESTIPLLSPVESEGGYSEQSPENLDLSLTGENRAVILYGQQDMIVSFGSVLSHESLFNSISWQIRNSSLSVGSKSLLYSSISTPASLLEIFSVICSGGTLVNLPARYRPDVQFIRFLKMNSIERVYCSQALLRTIADIAVDQDFIPVHLRELVVLGERVFVTHNIVTFLQNKLRGCDLHYHFGVREHLIVSSFTLNEEHLITMEWPNFMPIGHPIQNMELHVLDSNLGRVSLGVQGEVMIGGPTPSYLNKPELFEKRLVPNPFESSANEKLLHTGILGSAHTDTFVHLIGPVEQQTNLRGLRINIKEIESALEEHPAVQEAFVERHGDIGGNGLIAYLVSDRIVDRLTVIIKCQVQYEEEESITLITEDISSNGLKLQGVPSHWEKEGRLNLDILMPGMSEISLRGKITRIEGKQAGVKFEGIRIEEQARLKSSLAGVVEMEQLTLTHQSDTDLRILLRRPCRVEADGYGMGLTTSEISMTGISLVDVPENWEKGKKVVITLYFPGQEIRLDSVLSWREQDRTGFNITARPAELEKLQKYLRHFTEHELLTIAHLRSYLKEQLPYYMIPIIFVILESIPRLPDGTVNGTKLQFPVRKWYEAEIKNITPRTSIEGLLVGVWADVLKIDYDKIGINDNFFEIGGHSLLATELMAKIREEFNTDLPFQSLYKAPTVADLASEIIQKKVETGKNAQLKEAVQQLDSLSREDLKEIVLTQLTQED